MGCENVDSLKFIRASVDDVQEAQCLLDASGNLRVLFFENGIADMSQTPIKRMAKVSYPRGNRRANKVEGSRRVVVSPGLPVNLNDDIWLRTVQDSLEKTGGVNFALVLVVSVEDITTEAGHLLAIDNLSRAGARLGILAGHAADAHHALVGAPDEDDAHLEEQLDLGLDGVLLAVVEQLGAVAALQEEGVALGDVAEVRLEREDLGRVHQRRHAAEFGDRLFQLGLVRVGGGLLDGLGAPGAGRPARGRDLVDGCGDLR